MQDSLIAKLSSLWAPSTTTAGSDSPTTSGLGPQLRRGLRGFRTASVLAFTLASAATTSCGTLGTTEMNLSLAEQNVTFDLMNSFPLPIPAYSCTADSQCVYLVRNQLGLIDNRITPKCDMAMKQCVADVYVGVLVIIDFSMDTAFTTGIAQSSADAVREMTINYSLTNNTNLQIDKLDIFIGPDRLANALDPRAIYLDWIGPIPKGGTYTQEQKALVIQDETPAHAVVVEAIRNPTVPLNFLVQSYVHLKPGDSLPTGSLVLKLAPVVRLLKR